MLKLASENLVMLNLVSERPELKLAVKLADRKQAVKSAGEGQRNFGLCWNWLV